MARYETVEQDALDADPKVFAADSKHAGLRYVSRQIKSGTQVATDYWDVFKIPAGWKLLNYLSEVEFEAWGTDVVVDIGTDASSQGARYHNDKNISSAGVQALDNILETDTFTAEQWLRVTMVSLTALTANKTATFHLVFSAPGG